MAVFKRLTQHDGDQTVDVNMDLVLFVMGFDNFSSLSFGSGHGINVKETPDQIALAPALRFNSGHSKI